ncbi:MAG: hypothetical protein NC223_07890 [Butyrivibrio sp.]|nr:hypothetical protein [Butyrivibrio sp.]
MKDRFFSKGIFREQFRQLKIIGIVGGVLYTLLAVFIPIGINLSAVNLIHYDPERLSEYTERIGGYGVCMVQLLIPLIFVPLLTLTAFHFLTKRNSSDFYHALPVKRTAMYTGVLASVLAWTLIITLLPLLAMWAVCLPLKTVDFPFAELLKAFVNTLASCVFMTGITALGVNISGTLFTNIISSGIVLLLPRVILAMCWVSAGALVENSILEYRIMRLVLYGNPITKLVYLFGSGESFSEYFASGLAAGAAEGLVYLLAGGLFFGLRKSESASMSSINRGVQSIIRHMLALIFSTVASVFLVECIWYSHDEFEVFMAVLFYVLAVVVYFFYELITTRKWQSVAKSVRQLPFFAGMTAAIFAVISAVSISGNNYRMNAEDSEYVKIMSVSAFWGADYFFDKDDLPVKIRSAEIKRLIADAYNKNADAEGNGDAFAGSIAVAVREKGLTRKRYVYLNYEDMNAVLKEIYDVADVDLLQRFPELNGENGRYRLYLYWNVYDPCTLTSEELQRIYNTLRAEILDAGGPSQIFVRDNVICRLELHGYDGRTYFELPIGAGSETPETFRLIQDIIEERGEARSFAELYEAVSDSAGYGTDVSGRISFVSDTDKYNETKYYGLSLYPDEDARDPRAEKIYEILKKYEPNGDVEGENVVVESSEWYYGDYGVSFGVYNPSDEDMAELWNIIDGAHWQ